MSENLIESIRATVQDLLAPEIRTHSVRLEALDHKIDGTKETLVTKIEAVDRKVDEAKETLVAKIDAVDRALEETRLTLSTRIDGVDRALEETKQTLRADIRTVEVRVQSMEKQISGIEALIHQLGHQVSLEGSLRERIASLEARVQQH